MGDTFPHTFTCQDQRLRSGDMLSTFVQELGRLCRYPSVLPREYNISLSTAAVDGLGNNDEQRRLSILKRALVAAFGTGSWQGQFVHVSWVACIIFSILVIEQGPS